MAERVAFAVLFLACAAAQCPSYGGQRLHLAYPDGRDVEVFLVPSDEFDGEDMVHDDERLRRYRLGPPAPASASVNNEPYALVWICADGERHWEEIAPGSAPGARFEVVCR